MARIPESELERLKSEIAVERLVEGAGVELRRAGKDLLGRCPFHDDAQASLVVTPAKNLWHCFGCQTGGGPIDWVIKTRGARASRSAGACVPVDCRPPSLRV
ncbi:MAG TPA: CHC2 zinc finger domain-containing protein [Burkholderiales bacterium]|nr:CHC2 zinc finger domain-containing protein [Burkholderiales bacterium]